MTVQVCFTGNVTADPVLKFTPSGAAVCSFTVAVNERVKDGDKWRDGDPTYYEVTCWRQYAENVAETVFKGTRVVVMGKLKAKTYEGRDGAQRTVFDVQADEVGVALRYAPATVRKTERTQPRPGNVVHDPWASALPQEEAVPF